MRNRHYVVMGTAFALLGLLIAAGCGHSYITVKKVRPPECQVPTAIDRIALLPVEGRDHERLQNEIIDMITRRSRFELTQPSYLESLIHELGVDWLHLGDAELASHVAERIPGGAFLNVHVESIEFHEDSVGEKRQVEEKLKDGTKVKREKIFSGFKAQVRAEAGFRLTEIASRNIICGKNVTVTLDDKTELQEGKPLHVDREALTRKALHSLASEIVYRFTPHTDLITRTWEKNGDYPEIARALRSGDTGDWRTAVSTLEPVLARAPQCEDLWIDLGLAYELANRPVCAEELYRRVYVASGDNDWQERFNEVVFEVKQERELHLGDTLWHYDTTACPVLPEPRLK